MNDEHYLKQTLPFAECRYSKNSERQYKPHIHKTFTIGAVYQGEANYQIEDKSFKLLPGSLTLTNPETLHSCNPTESHKRSYYMLFLDIDWCMQVQQSMWQVDNFSPVQTVLLENNSVYRQFVDAMKVLMADGELLEKEQLLVDLVTRIFQLVCDPAPEINESSTYIELLKSKLNSNLEADTSLRQLAGEFNANPYSLLRQFKAATGITPHAYRLNYRIELAKKLLQKGHDLSQVALDCGFYDQSHFHHQFKSITTVTPKEYQVNFLQ